MLTCLLRVSACLLRLIRFLCRPEQKQASQSRILEFLADAAAATPIPTASTTIAIADRLVTLEELSLALGDEKQARELLRGVASFAASRAAQPQTQRQRTEAQTETAGDSKEGNERKESKVRMPVHLGEFDVKRAKDITAVNVGDFRLWWQVRILACAILVCSAFCVGVLH